MNKFTMSNLALLMSYKVSQKEIDKLVSGLGITPSDNMQVTSTAGANIAALQVLIRRYTSLSDYVADMNRYVADAVNRRAQLVCFPEYTGLLPVSLIPQLDKCLEAVRPLEETGRPDPVEVHKTLTHFSDFVFDAYLNTMASLAAQHRVYIMSGSTLYFEEDELCHRAFLFNHKGELVGYQDKLALSLLEQEMGIVPASELRLFQTPIGSLCILTGTDADYFETARIAKNMGADMLVSPRAFLGEYTPVTAALGLNMRVQETKRYGIQSALIGATGIGGIKMDGGCAIFAPNEMVKQKNGVLLKGSGMNEPDVVCTALDLDRLDQLQNPYWQDNNRDFMHKYADQIY